MDTQFTILFAKDVQIGGAFSVASATHLGSFMRLLLCLWFFQIVSFSNFDKIYAEQMLEQASSLESIIVSQEDTLILQRFFKTLFSHSEGGYVFWGLKPLCIHGFSNIDYFENHCAQHIDAVILKEGARVWKSYSKMNESNFILHVYDKPDEIVDNWYHILVINKKLFLQTVQENLALFQYVLGPQVTPENLLSDLIVSGKAFNEVIKNNKVLTGILLGFGTQNSLYVSRIEDIQNAYFNGREEIPLKSLYLALNDFKNFRNVLLTSVVNPKIDLTILQPSFSYTSIEEELHDIVSQIENSSQKLTEKKPNFVFGRIRGDKETASLIKDLEIAQAEIMHFLASENWFKKILESLIPNYNIEIEYPNENQFIEFNNPSLLTDLMVKNLWLLLQDKNEMFMEGFLKGIQDAENNVANNKQSGFYYKLAALKKAKDNVDEANHFFAELDRNQEFFPAKKEKVYFRTLHKGEGRLLEKEEKASFHCKITDPKGALLSDSYKENRPYSLYLKDLICGLSLGMVGMKEGETREIYIHPILGYGIYTTLEKGIYLKVEVKLLSVLPSEKSSFSVEESFDPVVFTKANINDFDEIAKDEGYALGNNVWTHYKKCSLYSLQPILNELKSAMHSKPRITLSEMEKNLINRLHWHIYQRVASRASHHSLGE